MKTIHCLCLTVLMFSATASAQHDWMPDAHLRRAVNEALGAPAGASFTREDLLKSIAGYQQNSKPESRLFNGFAPQSERIS